MAKKIGHALNYKGQELSKSEYHFEVLGNLDETSAAIAMAKAKESDDLAKTTLEQVQKDLSLLMGYLSGMELSSGFFEPNLVWIEEQIAALRKVVKQPKLFIQPGRNELEANYDLARTICRRAERSLVHYSEHEMKLEDSILQYLNRLSTLLYLKELQAGEE